jgi:hypothetical protein
LVIELHGRECAKKKKEEKREILIAPLYTQMSLSRKSRRKVKYFEMSVKMLKKDEFI